MSAPGGGFNLATVYVEVLPSMRGFSGRLGAGAGQAGAEAGQQAGARFTSTFRGAVKGVSAIAAAALAVGGGLAKIGLQGAASLETTTTAFTSLLGSSKAATAQIAELQKYAAQTPFEQQDVLGIAQQFYSLAGSIGQSKDQVIPFLDAVGNLGAVTGASVPDMQNAVRAIGQIGSSGKVTLENLNQVSEAFPGFNGAAAIASATGMTTAQTLDAISKGTIDAKTGVNALLVGMQQFPGAAGAMKAQAQTLNGVMSTFKDTVGIELTKAFTPLIPVVKSTLTQLTPIIATTLQQVAPVISSFVTNLGPALGPLVTGLGTVLSSVFQAIGPAISALTPVIAPLATAFAAVATAVSPLITLVGQIIGQVGPPLLNLFTTLATALAPVVQAFADAFAPVLPVIAQALQAVGRALAPVVGILAGALQTALAAIAPVLPQLARAFGSIAAALTPVVTLLAQGFASVIKALAPSIAPLANAVVQIALAFTKILVALSPLIPVFAKIVAEYITGYFVKIVLTLADAFVTVLRIITPLLPPLARLASVILPPLVKVFTAIGDVVSFVWNSVIRPVLKGLLNLFLTVVGGIVNAAADMFGWVPGVGGKLRSAANAINKFKEETNAAFSEVKNPVITPRLNLDPIKGDFNNLSILAGPLLAQSAAAGFNSNGVPLSAADATLGVPKSGPGSTPKKPATSGTPTQSSFAPSGATPAAAKAEPPKFDKSTLSSFLQTATGATANPLDAALKSIIDSAKKAKTGFTPKGLRYLQAQNKLIKAAVRERDQIAAKLQAAQARLQAAQELYNQQKSTVQSAVLGSFDIAKSGTGFDGQQPVTIGNILAQLKQTVARATQFGALLRRLRKQGLSKVLVSQLAAAGPDALPQAQALAAATPAQLAQVNSGYSALGREASGLGTFIANDMYKAGVQSAQGVINGLKSKQKNVVQAIKDLGSEMVRAIKKSLKIKSPSRVMFEVGEYTGQGFEQGIASKYADVRNASKNLGDSAVPGSASSITPGSAINGGISPETAAMIEAFEKKSFVLRSTNDVEMARSTARGQAKMSRAL